MGATTSVARSVKAPGTSTSERSGRPSAPLRRRKRRSAGSLAARALGYGVLSALSAISAVPLVWMVLTSFKRRDEVFGGGLLPSKWQGSAYAYIWQELHIWQYFLNSVVVTALTVVAVVVVSCFGGYAFAWLDIPAKRSLYALLLSALLIPAGILLIPAFLELRSFGLLNTRTGLSLVYIGTHVSFAILLMRTFFEAAPGELREAAKIDGAGEVRIFRSIMVPLTGPGIATVAIFQVLTTWNELLFANAFIQSQDRQPLQPGLYSLVGQHSTNWPALTAALTVAVAPVIVFYVFMQRQFVAGVTAGSVKG